MGKQSKKRQRQSTARSQEEGLLQRAAGSESPTRDIDTQRSPSPSAREEIEDNLSKIYESFFLEFAKRIAERERSDDPLLANTPQRSILDKKVKDKLVGRVHLLTRAIGPEDVYELFQVKTSEFIQKLLTEVKSTDSERLAIGLLEDAFDIMENAIEVVEGLISARSCIVIRYGRNEFYEFVLQDEQLKELFEHGSALEPQRNQRLYGMLDEEDSECAMRAEQQETIEKMSIDELVSFINEPQKPGRRGNASGTSTADVSTSPSRPEAEPDVDQEIEKFRERLETCDPVRTKVKPKLSAEWLKRLKILSKTR